VLSCEWDWEGRKKVGSLSSAPRRGGLAKTWNVEWEGRWGREVQRGPSTMRHREYSASYMPHMITPFQKEGARQDMGWRVRRNQGEGGTKRAFYDAS